jgi:hypothetical protein
MSTDIVASDQATASITVQGQALEYHPLSDEDLAAVIAKCTPKQALVLEAIGRGLTLAEAAKHCAVAADTVRAWRKQVPGYRDAYYTLYADRAHITPAAIRERALADSISHYDTLYEVSRDPEAHHRDRLTAASKALEIAGIGRDGPVVQVNFVAAVRALQGGERDGPVWE